MDRIFKNLNTALNGWSLFRRFQIFSFFSVNFILIFLSLYLFYKNSNEQVNSFQKEINQFANFTKVGLRPQEQIDISNQYLSGVPKVEVKTLWESSNKFLDLVRAGINTPVRIYTIYPSSWDPDLAIILNSTSPAPQLGQGIRIDRSIRNALNKQENVFTGIYELGKQKFVSGIFPIKKDKKLASLLLVDLKVTAEVSKANARFVIKLILYFFAVNLSVFFILQFFWTVIFAPLQQLGEKTKLAYKDATVFLNEAVNDQHEILDVVNSFKKVLFKQVKAEKSMDEIRKDFEQKVIDRTNELKKTTENVEKSKKDMKIILASLTEGVFTVSRDLKIHPEYSRALEKILETKTISGKIFTTILFPDDKEMASSWRSWVDSLFEMSDRFDLLKDLVDPKINFKSKKMLIRVVPVFDHSGKNMIKLLISVLDITEKWKSEQAMLELERKSKSETELLSAILSSGVDSFKTFVSDSKTALLEASTLCSEFKDEMDTEAKGKWVNHMFRVMHTLKGSARFYHVKAIEQKAHDFEDQLSMIREIPESITQEFVNIMQKALKEMSATHDEITAFSKDFFEKLGGSGGAGASADPDGAALDKEQLEALRDILTPTVSAANFSALEGIFQMEVTQMAKNIQTQVLSLAKQLNKSVDFKFESSHAKYDRKILKVFGNCLLHMIRNSLDHGIESPEKRESLGKPKMGELLMGMEKSIETLAYHFILKDDGAGIRKDIVVKRALDKGLIKDSNLTDQEIFQLLFMPGFSTAEVVTDMSGRGVGMDFVKSELQKLGGEMVIESAEGKGTKFMFIIPMPEYEKQAVKGILDANVA